MQRAPRTPSGHRTPLATSRRPGDWSPEYRDLAERIARDHGAALRRGGTMAPAILELHPGPACPASCSFCPTQGRKVYPPGRQRAALTAEEMRILVKDFAALGGSDLVLSGGLEPFTGPVLPAAGAAAEAGLRVHLYTSGLSPVLDDLRKRRALLEHVQRFRFSVNGFSEETYARVQLGGKRARGWLAHVKARIESLTRDREALASTSEIGLSFLVVPANRHEPLEVLRFATQVGLDFVDFLVDIDGEHGVEVETGDALEELRKTACGGGAGSPRVRISGRRGTAPALATRCAAPRVKIAVDPFGLVWRCCHVANPEIASPDVLLGDVREGGLFPILESARARPVRTGCKTCPDFERTFNALVSLSPRGTPGVLSD